MHCKPKSEIDVGSNKDKSLPLPELNVSSVTEQPSGGWQLQHIKNRAPDILPQTCFPSIFPTIINGNSILQARDWKYPGTSLMEDSEFQRGLEWFGRMERVEGEVRLGHIQDNLARWWSWGLEFQWGRRQLRRWEIQWAEPQDAAGWGGSTWVEVAAGGANRNRRPWRVYFYLTLVDAGDMQSWRPVWTGLASLWSGGRAAPGECPIPGIQKKEREEGEGRERGQRQADTSHLNKS